MSANLRKDISGLLHYLESFLSNPPTSSTTLTTAASAPTASGVSRLNSWPSARAKGLGYDNVNIIIARNELYGFPSQIQEDRRKHEAMARGVEYIAEASFSWNGMLTITANADYSVTMMLRFS